MNAAVKLNPFARQRTVADRRAETDVVRICGPVRGDGYLFVVGKADTHPDKLAVFIARGNDFWFRFWGGWNNHFPCYQARQNYRAALDAYLSGRVDAAPMPSDVAMAAYTHPSTSDTHIDIIQRPDAPSVPPTVYK